MIIRMLSRNRVYRFPLSEICFLTIICAKNVSIEHINLFNMYLNYFNNFSIKITGVRYTYNARNNKKRFIKHLSYICL